MSGWLLSGPSRYRVPLIKCQKALGPAWRDGPGPRYPPRVPPATYIPSLDNPAWGRGSNSYGNGRDTRHFRPATDLRPSTSENLSFTTENDLRSNRHYNIVCDDLLDSHNCAELVPTLRRVTSKARTEHDRILYYIRATRNRTEHL